MLNSVTISLKTRTPTDSCVGKKVSFPYDSPKWDKNVQFFTPKLRSLSETAIAHPRLSWEYRSLGSLCDWMKKANGHNILRNC